MTSQHFPRHSSHAAAAHLIDIGCVTVRTDEPFRLPSGWTSPVYMDCRRLISFPAVRRELVTHAVEKLKQQGCLNGVASVAGGEASGIAIAAWIADRLDLPLQFVRKRPAGLRQVEGVFRPGDKIVLIDDLMAAGMSKLGFVSALRAAGAAVEDVFVVFDYGCFGASSLLASVGTKVHSLAIWADVLSVARARKDFSEDALIELEEFLRDPATWSESHGGLGTTTAIQKVIS